MSHSRSSSIDATDEYLDRTNVTAFLKDAVTLLLENRPENPIKFLADYFQAVVSGSTPIQRSYRYLRLSPHDRQIFMDNLFNAYLTLDTTRRSAATASGTAATGPANAASKSIWTCDDFSKLLALVCADFPPEVAETVLKVLNKEPADLITFEEFAGGVKACMIYEDFFLDAETIFNQLNEKHGASGRVAATLFVAAVKTSPQSSCSEIAGELESLLRSSGKLNSQLSLQDITKLIFESCRPLVPSEN
eukprot:GILI01042248.1.p1 GENE.GILI01042248.1~~GILI01042248.1.p1  ORF type:complete len:248 (-),score=39.55 GILI01042248.1:77-820(-)